MDRVIYKAIHPDANMRYQTASEMRRALVNYLESQRRALPLEVLRQLLQPGNALSESHGHRSATPMPRLRSDPGGEERTPTEIGLAVAERCGKCGGPFAAFFLDGMIVDRCSSCRGVWLDYGELDRIIGQASEAPHDGAR